MFATPLKQFMTSIVRRVLSDIRIRGEILSDAIHLEAKRYRWDGKTKKQMITSIVDEKVSLRKSGLMSATFDDVQFEIRVYEEN